MDIAAATGIALGSIALIGLVGSYLGFILKMEHRLTKVETIVERIPFEKVLDLMTALVNKVPHTQTTNPHDRRSELMGKLRRFELTRKEANELNDIVGRDVEASDQEDAVKALILLGIGLLIGWALANPEKRR